MTKLEELARALAERDRDANVIVGFPDVDSVMAFNGQYYRRNARAAIEALREPSEKMRHAGAFTIVDDGMEDFPGVDSGCVTVSARLSNKEAEIVWQAMIQAVLEE